uniref:Ectonucleoside triphosphate diphosphohydrolase 1 n=1 Tax=Chrysemys picta bellii TaxID=8478 RepID=A0A8C3P3V6_CHRPI
MVPNVRSSLPVTGTKPRTSWPRKALLILGFLFALAAIALVAMAVSQNKPLPKNIKYGIVLDAGSSHTNLYVYEWPAEKENDTGVVHQVEVCKVEGLGISGYSQDTEKAGLSLQHCMKRAQEVVPEQQHRETPVYLGATAGMRLLSLQNRSMADRVLSAVEKTLRSSPFNFQGARVISGQEEGAYGWITINYLLGNFKQAFSAFYFVMNFLNLTTEKSPVPLDKATSAVESFCSRPWHEVKAEFPKIKEKYLSEYCFSGTYILSLLENGYGFTMEKWQNIQFLGKIGSSDAGWTLGYMLNLTNMIPAEKPPTRPLSHASYVGLMVFCSLVLVAVLLLSWLTFHKPKCLQKGLI